MSSNSVQQTLAEKEHVVIPSQNNEKLQYKLFYHGGAFAGRGEPIRMMLWIVCGGDQELWEDTCKVNNVYGPEAVRDCVKENHSTYPVLFPPVLLDLTTGSNDRNPLNKNNDLLDDSSGKIITVNQMSCILQYLGEKHGLAGETLEERCHALQIALTWNDLLENAMAAYHPLDPNASYISQKQAAMPYITKFMETRLPKYLMHLEECLKKNREGMGYIVGNKLSFADICILNMMRGYRGSALEHYKANHNIPLLKGLEVRLREEESIKTYLASDKTVDEFQDSFC